MRSSPPWVNKNPSSETEVRGLAGVFENSPGRFFAGARAGRTGCLSHYCGPSIIQLLLKELGAPGICGIYDHEANNGFQEAAVFGQSGVIVGSHRRFHSLLA